MGWGRMLLLGNIGQQLDIEDQKKEIARLRRSVRKGGRADLRRLEGEVDELRLFLAALVRIVVAKGVMTPEELRAVVEAVDAEDGSADGRFEGPVA